MQNSIVEEDSRYEIGEDIYNGVENVAEHGKIEADFTVEAFQENHFANDSRELTERQRADCRVHEGCTR